MKYMLAWYDIRQVRMKQLGAVTSEERIRLYLLETTKQGSELIIKQEK